MTRPFNGGRYGKVRSDKQVVSDSGGCKPATQLEVVFKLVNGDRERKLRSKGLVISHNDLFKMMKSFDRPQGRSGRRSGRKGKGCAARRKMARLVQKSAMVKGPTYAPSQDIQALAPRQDPQRRIKVVMTNYSYPHHTVLLHPSCSYLQLYKQSNTL